MHHIKIAVLISKVITKAILQRDMRNGNYEKIYKNAAGRVIFTG
jgi:hypothetical protein